MHHGIDYPLLQQHCTMHGKVASWYVLHAFASVLQFLPTNMCNKLPKKGSEAVEKEKKRDKRKLRKKVKRIQKYVEQCYLVPTNRKLNRSSTKRYCSHLRT